MFTAALTKRSVSVRTFWRSAIVSPLLRSLHLLEREAERAAQAVVEHLRADLLGDEPQHVVLERRRKPRGEGHRRRDEQPAERAAHELAPRAGPRG